MKRPDHRAEEISAGAEAATPEEAEFAALLRGETVSEQVKYAVEIYEDSYKSEVLEAFLLAGASSEIVYNHLRVPVPVVDTYRRLFFDLSVFRDELDVEAYTQTYPENTPGEKWGKDLKICAISLGLDYMTYRFGRNGGELDIQVALKQIIGNANMLAKVSKINPLDSNATREARAWAQTTLKALETWTKVAPMADKTDDDFRVALQTIETTTNEQKSAIKKDDLVH